MQQDYNIQSDIEINQYQLENECITMSSTYFKYADMAREAKADVSFCADNLKVVTAERNIAIREDLANSGQKITEGIITSTVQSDGEVKIAMQKLREAEATYERLNVAVKALEIKKSELDNLVKLRCNSMYVDSPSKPTRDIKNETMTEYNRRTMTPLPN
jgi:hypothetical protein